MACTSPLIALDLGLVNGKRKIKILPKRPGLYSMETLSERYKTNRLLYLPCGSCLECKTNKAKEWAVRCVLEAKEYESNYFITLTYDEAHVPEHLSKNHLQTFIRRCRKVWPDLRYFACGEYGGKTGRPHYHLILFNVPFNDLRLLGRKFENVLFTSARLSNLWPFGHSVIAEFNYATAAYVARYTLKKIGSSGDEFILMSLKPGIGASYFEKNYKNIYDVDKVYGNFGGSFYSRPPRYFDKLLERIDLGLFERIKSNRLNASNKDALDFIIKHNLRHYEQMFIKKESISFNKKSKYLERSL